MKYKLISELPLYDSPIEQVLRNRGIEDPIHYINSTDKDINDPKLLGKNLEIAMFTLLKHIKSNSETLIIVDSDCDGFTSSAFLLNYLYDFVPSWVTSKVSWIFHEGKQHGLSDIMEVIQNNNYKLVIIPDAGSNDNEQCAYLKNENIDFIILDHHEVESKPEDFMCVINNQLSDYPNKDFSGVGIVWQFCRFLDLYRGGNYADNYLDLVALGNVGDMMSLTSIETKHIIQKGFEPENVKNPFIFNMWQKNKFKIGDVITHFGAAFYIVPFINAVNRSGTKSEKEIVFAAMLNFMANQKVTSTKRGHSLGEEETLCEQAMRVCTNVKNRQTKAEDAGLTFIEKMIEENNMLEHKVLLFLLKPGQVDKNIAGLIANKIMAKYQRPCCILTKDPETGMYAGSARGYHKNGVESFKDVCAETSLIEFVAGHANAFGLGIKEENIENFILLTDETLANISPEPVYYVDYIFNENTVDQNLILDLASYTGWGQDVDKPLVVIKDVTITPDNFKIMRANTLKILLPNNLSIIRFGGTEKEIEDFTVEQGSFSADIVCECERNEWNGNVYAQLKLKDYEITDKSLQYYF